MTSDLIRREVNEIESEIQKNMIEKQNYMD